MDAAALVTEAAGRPGIDEAGFAIIGFSGTAARADTAFRNERNDMIARLHAGHAGSDLEDDARGLMAHQSGEAGVEVPMPLDRVHVRVTEACGFYLDQDLAVLRRRDIDHLDLQRGSEFECHRGLALYHDSILPLTLRLRSGLPPKAQAALAKSGFALR